MKSIDSLIPSLINEDIEVESTTLNDFLLKDTCMAKLIYCDETMVNDIEAIVGENVILLNEDDPARYRNLTATSVAVVTSEEMMRGIDYKCSTGISLLIAKTLSNPRIYLQCLGRVGRWTDACKRYILTGIMKHETENHNEMNLFQLNKSIQKDNNNQKQNLNQ